MKIIKIAAIAAASAVAFAGAASAKDHDGYKGHHKGHAQYQRTWDARHHRWVVTEWAPPGLAKKPYGMPPGQAKKVYVYTRGQHLPRDYYANQTYYVVQPQQYDLRAAPPGYQWVRVGNDVYLTQTRTGLIADVIANLLH